MGVPKFYRWVSERYPNISRVINDNQIPDFDNFYLDMNGIIHACSHVNEDNCETNVTEEEIFRNIFHYIDFLFRMIKPKKVFFLAVDGVAPRAKMNQQRARRFRAGRDRIKKLKTLAEKNGQTLKETIAQHFDTNAITPGTKFMSNLDEQLKYFINIKITTDPLWKDVEIYLSGHLTPGEGEHKIMEYIRYTRSQPGYDINTRHCLYGLDADLIMLGLVTHEMHFALLREEVKYGPKKISKILTPEEINWHLLQLCLLRDYINLEFHSIKEKLKFSYDLESIVDDWILMGYLVGNDFIPHLPHVHINQEALPILWETYKKVLPTLDGYMNESGELNLSRFENYLIELSKYDYERFLKENDSLKQLDKLTSSKSKKSELDKDQIPNQGFSPEILEKLMITTPINSKKDSNENDSNGQMIDNFIANERQSSNISSSSSSDDIPPPIYPDADDDNNNPSSDSDRISDNDVQLNNNEDYKSTIKIEFRQYKNNYYREKMKSDSISSEQIQVYVQQYIEALQWILKYYYQGCQSWSWFYPHHYATYLSDLINFKHLQFSFQKGIPFKPFEQLLGVLPPTSRYLLPTALQPLMIDAESPLLHFYPEDFQLDQNEKKKNLETIFYLTI
jgi:5'-3' exoribonuclease 1